MQLTSPLFLFLFLPLSLALFFLTPPRARAAVLALLSAAWLLLANWGNLWGIVQLFLAVLLAALTVLLPRRPAPLLPIVTSLLIGSFIAARVLTFFTSSYVYPTGLLFITLSALSLLFDTVRGDIKHKPSLTGVLCYLLFFPTATLGPAVRYKHFAMLLRKSTPSTTRFCDGIRLFMLGYIKRIGMAAVLYRAVDTVLDNARAMPFIALPAVLLFALLLFYFFVSGCADMARGLAAMYGMRLPRDRTNLLCATAPHEILGGLFLSVQRYLDDYLTEPLCRHARRRRGMAAAAAALVTLLLVLLFLPTPAAWIAGTVFVLSAAVCALSRKTEPTPHPVRNTLYFLLSAFVAAPAALLAVSGDARRVWTLVRAVFDGEAARSYSFYFVVPDLQYILLSVAVFAVLVLLAQLLHRNAGRIGERLAFAVSLATTVLLFFGFLLSLLYLMPQFPQYALSPFGKVR